MIFYTFFSDSLEKLSCIPQSISLRGGTVMHHTGIPKSEECFIPLAIVIASV